MKRQKLLVGHVREGAGGGGIIGLSDPGARPARETAVSTAKLTDGPYEYFDASPFERVSVAVSVASGAAKVRLQGANVHPLSIPNALLEWVTLAETAELSIDGGAFAAALEYEGAMRLMRLTWADATASAPEIEVQVFAR